MQTFLRPVFFRGPDVQASLFPPLTGYEDRYMLVTYPYPNERGWTEASEYKLGEPVPDDSYVVRRDLAFSVTGDRAKWKIIIDKRKECNLK